MYILSISQKKMSEAENVQHLLLETSSLYHLLFTYFFFSKYIWSISLPSISRTCVASWRNHTELQKPAENKKQLRIHFLYLYYNPPERTAFLGDLASCRGSLDSQSFLTQPACHLGLDSLGFIFSFCLSRDSNWNARCRTLIDLKVEAVVIDLRPFFFLFYYVQTFSSVNFPLTTG